MREQRRRNVAASVRQRLVNHAHAHGGEAERVFVHYCLERLLYRLSRSAYRDDFVLKGAMLFRIWDPGTRRPTRDIDLLAYGEPDIERFEAVIRDLCGQAVEDDGVVFFADSVRGSVIKAGDEYQGVRVQARADLGRARMKVQVDIGFGDAIIPPPVEIAYPTLLEMPPPVLRAYRMETAIAEKFHAMVDLGTTTTRLKDFYDVWTLSQRCWFSGDALAAAIGATFRRRGAVLPDETPPALTDTFGTDPVKDEQWRAFVRRNRLAGDVVGLDAIVETLRGFLLPPVEALRAGRTVAMTWPQGGPWQAADPAEGGGNG